METASVRAPRAWVLNLDAEYELANLTMPASKQASIAKFARNKFPFLCAEDRVVGREHVERGLQGFAWCPTPHALAELAQVGARLPEAPPVETLRAVNHRGFAEPLGWPLPESSLLDSLDAAIKHLRTPRHWCAKRPLSAAGHGKRFIDGGDLSETDRAWLEATLRRQGSLLIEPRVQVGFEFSVHGQLDIEGTFRVDVPRAQNGGYVLRDELSAEHHFSVVAEACRVARALAAAKYFGPFGVDGYLGKLDGLPVFVPRSEINARYTMNFPADLIPD